MKNKNSGYFRLQGWIRTNLRPVFPEDLPPQVQLTPCVHVFCNRQTKANVFYSNNIR